jgi:hypothetical protein
MRRLLFFLLLILFTKCDLNNQKLLISNSSDKTLYYLLLTDTILSNDYQLNKLNSNSSVFPNFVFGGNGAWEYKINSDSKDSTLHIFILPSEYLNDSIIKNRKYERLDFKVKDLNSLGWKVVIKD